MLRYLWAAPATLLGLGAGAVALSAGSKWRVVDGVIELYGGWVGKAAAKLPIAKRFIAVTLGHVVLARDSIAADACRAHEHAHVRQYERWGLLFFPLYAASSLWEAARGRGFYRANHFERQARAAAEVHQANPS